MTRKTKALPSPTGLTDACFLDIAEFELQADPGRIYLGFRLQSGAQFWLHIVHRPEGFQVLIDQDRQPPTKVM